MDGSAAEGCGGGYWGQMRESWAPAHQAHFSDAEKYREM